MIQNNSIPFVLIHYIYILVLIYSVILHIYLIYINKFICQKNIVKQDIFLKFSFTNI